MPETDPALIEITSEVVSAYLANNHVPSAELPALIASVHDAFAGLGRAPEPAAEPEKPVPAVPVRKSVTEDYLVSLEDGKHYKALKRHLTTLGLTPAEYRAKWGLPADYPHGGAGLCPPAQRARQEHRPGRDAEARLTPTAATVPRASGRSAARCRPAP